RPVKRGDSGERGGGNLSLQRPGEPVETAAAPRTPRGGGAVGRRLPGRRERSHRSQPCSEQRRKKGGFPRGRAAFERGRDQGQAPRGDSLRRRVLRVGPVHRPSPEARRGQGGVPERSRTDAGNRRRLCGVRDGGGSGGGGGSRRQNSGRRRCRKNGQEERAGGGGRKVVGRGGAPAGPGICRARAAARQRQGRRGKARAPARADGAAEGAGTRDRGVARAGARQRGRRPPPRLGFVK
ncbi:unnamed protein product, partial [Ectocarpus fasciculatus]